MSSQSTIMQLLLMQAVKLEKAMIPYIEVPYGVDTTRAIQNAIQDGFPVTKCPPRFCAPSVHYSTDARRMHRSQHLAVYVQESLRSL